MPSTHPHHYPFPRYGNVRTVIEREPVKDLRIALSGELKLGAGGGENAIGLRVSLGPTAALPRNLSPILMSRTYAV